MSDESELRSQWWGRYASVQKKYDIQIRTLLIQGAQDAEDRLTALSQSSTFSAGVRTAQLHLALNEIKKTHHDIFGQMLPIIKSGQKDEASAAMDGLSATDKQYIYAAISGVHNAESYLKSARQTARLGVTHAIQRVAKSERPLSAQVYRTESLANHWVRNVITNALVRGDSAKELAKAVRKHILPTVPGGTSYAALRLGRTELNNAFHATSITAAQDRPWVTGMRWHVSETHIDDPKEICTQLKDRLFQVEDVPGKPHPQCRCYVAAEVESLEVFKQHLTMGTYRDWIENAA